MLSKSFHHFIQTLIDQSSIETIYPQKNQTFFTLKRKVHQTLNEDILTSVKLFSAEFVEIASFSKRLVSKFYSFSPIC